MQDLSGSVQISLRTLQSHTKSYDSLVPSKLSDLEELRLSTIPQTLAQRKGDGNAFLEKSEVTSLVEWKLKHGTYRPNLAKLVSSNSDADIHSTTKTAFSSYEADNDDFAKSITTLSKLKGIGPATASLLLSCYDPIKVPFFSDELFRWLHWEEAKGKGWDSKINYSMKEYKSLFEKVQELRERLEKANETTVAAINIEKAAYVLGRTAASGSKRALDMEDEEKEAVVKQPNVKRQRKTLPKKSSKGG